MLFFIVCIVMNKLDKATVTSEDLARKISHKLDLSLRKSKKVLNTVIDEMISSVEAGNKVELRGRMVIGSKLVNPVVSEGNKMLPQFKVPARRKAYFKAGKRLEDMEML